MNKTAKGRKLDVKKDPLDLRDVMYEPSLDELPASLDNRRLVPRPILDQGQEGACTGFGLAAAANFLLHNRTLIARRKRVRVSPRMLYEMAKRYDEWEGEHYEGSSIRGAMKGWNKHGVCTQDDWPYDPKDPERLTPERQEAALQYRLGAYYRVRHLHLNHMHSALNAVGILYVSATVHDGWEEVDPKTGRIPYRRKPRGGHAFAIVGYDEDGFWIQNSWGDTWGKGGFAHLSYGDWFENGFDCWVARLGVATTAQTLDEGKMDSRLLEFDYIPHEAAVHNDIRLHYVNLGNDGQFSRSGLYSSDKASLEDVINDGLKVRARQWGGTTKLLLYAHGGLTNEKVAAIGIRRMRERFLENRIYPIHFIWETGLTDSVRGIVEDAFRRGRFQGWRDDLRDRFEDLLDEAIELAARPFGLPIWSQMKDNARKASRSDPEGGAAYLAKRLARFANEDCPIEVHLMGHSAGAIFHSHLVPQLLASGLPVKTLTLLAPACTTELFDSNVIRRVQNDVERLTIFNLNDEFEQGDNVTPLYNKSILYLVSEAFEAKAKTPILGMEKFAAKSASLKEKVGAGVPAGRPTVVRSVGGPSVKLESSAETHGDFDNDAATLNSALRIILGSDRIARPFVSSVRTGLAALPSRTRASSADSAASRGSRRRQRR